MRRLLPLLLVSALTSCAAPEKAADQAPTTVTSTVQVPRSAPQSEPDEPLQPSPSATAPHAVPDTELDASVLQPIVDGAVARFGGSAGVAISDGATDASAGDDAAYPAWSTIKVPISIAALRQDPALRPTAAAAIQSSDNDAAQTLWDSLPPRAADAVLAEGENSVTVNTAQLRPEFSTFGQTPWSPSEQARFAANLPCIAGSQDVLAMMSQVAPSQSYGLGQLPGARFKGGWGPDTAGMYQLRQFGLVAGAGGDVAVALTASPGSGSYADASAMATQLAGGISSTLDQLPAASCA